MMAPFTPFMAEELYQKMTGSGESVHLLDFPTEMEIDEQVLEDMVFTRDVIEAGLALRADRNNKYGQIKVRQPLSELKYHGKQLNTFYESVISEEVNVKKVIYDKQGNFQNRFDGRVSILNQKRFNLKTQSQVYLNKEIDDKLKAEGQAREIIRVVQNARKDAGLNIDDRIKLSLQSESKELQKVVQVFAELIKAETLATELVAKAEQYTTEAEIDGEVLAVSLAKA
jgi:isoleucyl-tRNA synthetase